MRPTRLSSISERRRGAAAVEFAIVAPFLAFLFVCSVDFCRVFYYSITVSNCARNGAFYGSVDRAHALDTSGIVNACKLDAGNLDTSKLAISVSVDSTSSPSYVMVSVSFPFVTVTNYPGIPTTTNLVRSVRMSVLPATPNF